MSDEPETTVVERAVDNARVKVAFPYCGYRVTVSQRGQVTLRELAPSAERTS